MHHEYAYDIVGVVFLWLVTISFRKKNWLDLRFNQLFNKILHVSLVFSIADIILRLFFLYLPISVVIENYALTLSACTGIFLLVALFFRYVIVLIEPFGYKKKGVYQLFMLPVYPILLLIWTTPLTHFLFLIDKSGDFVRGVGLVLLIFFFYFYAFGMIIVGFYGILQKSWINAGIWLVLSLLDIFLLQAQQLWFQNRIIVMYYAMDCFVVFLYLFFETLDRFNDRISGGFSRAGFRKILEEKFKLRERFACLFIEIDNYQTLKAICRDEEICEVMGQIGFLLRKEGGRKNQFHIHGSEFVVLKKTDQEIQKLYDDVVEILPTRVRVQNRHLPISYTFFALTMDEAAYNKNEFLKMANGMKKAVRGISDSQKLIRYEGEIRKNIDTELYVGRCIKKILIDKKCDLMFSPIINTETGKCHAMEIKTYITREGGNLIPDELIWKIAGEMGYMHELWHIVLKTSVNCIKEEHLMEKGIKKIVYNLLSRQICSSEYLREFQEMYQLYNLPLDIVTIEVTEDSGIELEKMLKNMEIIKEKGISMSLDNYGQALCNLQNISKLPFDFAKINCQMIGNDSVKNCDALSYQIDMLRGNGFGVCVNGVNTKKQYDKMKELGICLMQGAYFTQNYSRKALSEYLEDM